MTCIDYDGLWGNLVGADQDTTDEDVFEDPTGEGWEHP